MFFGLIHEHYWSAPFRQPSGYYMICYECGKQHKLKVDLDDLFRKGLIPLSEEKDHKDKVKLAA